MVQLPPESHVPAGFSHVPKSGDGELPVAVAFGFQVFRLNTLLIPA